MAQPYLRAIRVGASAGTVCRAFTRLGGRDGLALPGLGLDEPRKSPRFAIPVGEPLDPHFGKG